MAWHAWLCRDSIKNMAPLRRMKLSNGFCIFWQPLWHPTHTDHLQVKSASWVIHRDLYQFLHSFRTQMAGRMDRILDPDQITPSFICFSSLDVPAPTPAPLASTHCRLAVRDAVWCNSPSVASTGPIFRQSEIVTFVTSVSQHDGRRRWPIKCIGMIENVIENNY